MNEILASLKAKKPSIIGQFRELREEREMPPEGKELSDNMVLQADNASERKPQKGKKEIER